jgi:hypothetical protein
MGFLHCLSAQLEKFCRCRARIVHGPALHSRGGHRHLQIGRMLDIDLISGPPHAPSPKMYEYKVWESVWPEGQEAIHS